MSDIVEFLIAQYDKREAIARRSAVLQLDPENGWGIDGRAITPHIGVIHEDAPREHIALHNPAAVLADIKSKSKILATYMAARELATSPDDVEEFEEAVATEKALIDVLRCLATAFSDEPDYDEKWMI